MCVGDTKKLNQQDKCIIIKEIYIFIIEHDIILSGNNPVWLTEPIDTINDIVLQNCVEQLFCKRIYNSRIYNIIYKNLSINIIY